MPDDASPLHIGVSAVIRLVNDPALAAGSSDFRTIYEARGSDASARYASEPNNAVLQAIGESGEAGKPAFPAMIRASDHDGGTDTIPKDETAPTVTPAAAGPKPVRGSAPPPYQRP